MQLTGTHHLTAISAKPCENLAFYTGLLGMGLIKNTVNQDHVSAWHLFCADGKANPGTDRAATRETSSRPSAGRRLRSRREG